MSQTQGQKYVEIVTSLLRQDGPPAPTRFPGDRARLVAAVERGLRARRRRRLIERGLVVTGVAAAASLALLIGGLTFLHTGPLADLGPRAPGTGSHALTVLSSPPSGGGAAGVMVGGGAAPVPLARGMTLSRGLRLVAPKAGEVRIGAARGTNLTLEGGGEMAIGEDGAVQRYELRTGAVRAQVAKLVPGERFIVATADTEIEVHGTAFRVAVVPADPGCGGGTITRLSVSEGVVTVRRDGVETRVLPGQVWPERCVAALGPGSDAPAGPAASGSTSDAASTPSTPPGPHRGGARGVARASLAPGDDAALDAEWMLAPDQPGGFSRSELAAQNDLYASAVRAKREGRGAEAIRIFERFGRQYPRGPLAESAAVQRMKLLGAIDLSAARRAAADYLRRYPSGFARTEAQGLVEIKTSGF